MPFDEARYAQEFIKRLRGARSLPDDLLARYALTLPLPATDPQIAAQVKAVRAYWNKIYQGSSYAAQAARMCRAEDERLQAKHGTRMETLTWWKERQAERSSAAQASVTALADDLRQAYGKLGVVTAGRADGLAAKLGLTHADAVHAVEQAGLTLVDGIAIPGSMPIASFPALLRNMSECAVSSVPELVHPGAGPFSLLDRYACTGDPGKRLDVVAVIAQSTEADKRRVSATENARREALKILRRALKDGVDLRDVALYHLVTIAGEFAPDSAGIAAAELEKMGLDRKDAAVLAVVLHDQSLASGAVGLDKVRQLIGSGQLNEATQAAMSLPAESGNRQEAIKEVEAARARLDGLLAEARKALEVPDEVRAAALLREAALISAEDAEEALAAVPPAPPAGLRAVCEEAAVKLFWQPAPGHDDGTTYVVTRTVQRPPAAVGDGSVVHRGQANSCNDAHAPVARIVQYGVFALADRRPNSRPAVIPVTLLPPVSQLEADVGPAEATIHWSAHPAAQEVRVTRSAQGVPPAPVAVTGNSCHLSGLAEGQAQHFEVTAIYRGLDGTELRSAVEQINATPRSEARPIPKLRVRPIEVGGAAGVRVAWTPIDNSEVRILRSAVPPGWQFGTWVSQEEMTQFGQEVTGRRQSGRTEIAIEAEMPAGVHHFAPFSIGGTGIVMGRPAVVGVTDPVRRLVVTPFATHATVSWEWPPTAQLAEVSWELDGDADSVVIGQAQYRSQGGARVPLGRGHCTVEVRAVIMADGVSFTSPPVQAVVDSVTDVAISYTVSTTAGLGPFGGRSKKVAFRSSESCQGVHVRMVAFPGRVMPAKAEGGFVILDATLALQPGLPAEHHVTVPRQVKRPYWVRCFVVGGQARLVDPPISSLKET
jgi:conjugal transfer/entry exclusion protein